MAAAYKNLAFDTHLLAQWAAFFDIAGWRWSREVAAVGNWIPDYQITFDCEHSECGSSHIILVSVFPFNDISTVLGHPALKYSYGIKGANGKNIADAGAIFGSDYHATCWEMSHGAGGGIETVANWVDNSEEVWREAGSLVHALGNET